jgi:Met-zincin/Domain of unknown function (DUF5117)
MKKLTLLALFCCSIFLATPVHAWQVAIAHWHSAVDESVAIVAPLEEGRSPEASPTSPQADPLLVSGLPPQLPGMGEVELQPFDQVVEKAEVLRGLFTLYRNAETGSVFLEVKPDQLDRNFLLVTTLESGVGEWGLFSGMPLNDYLFQLRRVQNQVQFVAPNTNFRTEPTDPQRRSVARSFSDSVLHTLPIRSIHPTRQTLLVEVNDLLLGGHDLAGLMSSFPWVLGSSYTPDDSQMYIDQVKVFPQNVEIEAVQGFTGGTNSWIVLETLPDPRSFSLKVRYSLSQLPETNNNYRPRLADERLGYFVTAYQDLSRNDPHSPFVRYLQRWHLEPQDPTAALSPPKKPIVFWIENTVPIQYRDAIREGVLLWNAAFETAGFKDAIEVKQMPDDATWDPADVRYNTIRWSNSFQSALTAIGPSRANPLTGEILDADVIIDANAVRLAQENTDILTQSGQADAVLAAIPQLCSYGTRIPYLQWLRAQGNPNQQGLRGLDSNETDFSQHSGHELCFGLGSSRQAAFGSLSLAVMQNVSPTGDEMQVYLHQFLRWLTAHEVGHVLGLRHNFRGSTMLKPEDLNNSEVTSKTGLSGSVMDYIPVNLAPPGQPQGDYFPTTLGPYDRWVIEYGYRQFPGIDRRAEARDLQTIAQRSAEPGLAYATDEDGMDFLDTEANLWDLSGDMLLYSRWQMDNARTIWSKLERRYPLPGESYSELRDRFSTVFDYYVQQALNLTRYVGGQRFNRDRRGDPGGRVPFEFVSIDKQREALSTLHDYVFADGVFAFSPDLLNRLAPSRWLHWGSVPAAVRLDYPIYDNILFLQTIVLSDLLSADRLSRLRDAELRAHSGEVLTLPELFDTVQTSIWSEVSDPADNLTISSLRRGLQRQHLNLLTNIMLQDVSTLEDATNFLDFITAYFPLNAPEDASVLARYQLRQLQEKVVRTLRRSDSIDLATKAHLEAVRDRISKALDAPV